MSVNLPAQPDGVVLKGPLTPEFADILTPEALSFVASLVRRFDPERKALLAQRVERQREFDAGRLPDFLAETAGIREGDWRVAPVPADLQDRRVEITGPASDAKMVINALNSGAKVFMADFEDANSPTWENSIGGQVNLKAALNGNLRHVNPDGRVYQLKPEVATLVVRPRGWHLPEKHLVVDGEAAPAALVDFGLYFFHNAQTLLRAGSGPYFYLPKLEGHREARLWNEVFLFAQDALGLKRGTIKATVLIETILAAFEMDEILYELREHAAGLNAGRWDYIFSVIKKFRHHPDFLLPDRNQVTMTVPFMRAYTELLVRTCHRRGAHAIGGMAAFIPSRRDAQVNELAFQKVREDKVREASAGYDGTWVAHPDLVPVAREVFDRHLGPAPHQVGRLREDVTTTARDLLDVRIPGGTITEAGLRVNISVGLQYLEAWLRGYGAVGINNLMEDAATAEISRAQVWQWVRHEQGMLTDGRKVTLPLVRTLITEELTKLFQTLGTAAFQNGRFEEAGQIFLDLTENDTFEEFLTLPAYALLP